MDSNQTQEGPLLSKSFLFAIRIVKFHKFLGNTRERVMSKQLLRCGTAIGALVREAQYAESRADFIHKLCIALKEANEACYWIDLLYHTQIIDQRSHSSLKRDAQELLRMLVSATKTLKSAKIAS